MLDSTTRKRIDDCRDILVGKLPDPKAQIEQITIGLIYKFMDDMDKEAIELGGKPKFFSNFNLPDPDNPEDRSKDKLVQFEQYRWDNLFNSKVTASEMLRLYSEAIENMEKNPNIPQLFRDIFNNAYLPYRDPETLKMFLKTIGEFEYTHSEKLGDAFEYLLQVMGSQGDAGQFRTPRHIIDFLVAIVDPGKNDTILDPACGTAGFLISAYKHTLLKNTKANEKGLDIYSFNNKYDKPPFNNLGDNLTPDQKKKLVQNFAGYDISPDMVRLSLVNLYLHGFPEPHIHEYDTLSSEARWNENFDVILANPPFMSPKGGIRPHKKFTINSKRSEVLFVDYIAEHLNPKGRAGIIVPEGVIFQSGTAYKDLRKMLVENYLYGVVSLPAGVFNPYSGVKTSILLLDAELAKKSKEILFIKIENDGYNLGAQRTSVKGGQLEVAIKTSKSFKNSILEGENFENTALAHSVKKTEIAQLGDYNLNGDRYKKLIEKSTNWELVSLKEVTLSTQLGIVRNKSNQGNYSKEFPFPYIKMDALNWNSVLDLKKVTYVNASKEEIDNYSLNDGDFLYNTRNAPNLVGKCGVYHGESKNILFNNNILRIKFDKSRANSDFIYRVMVSDIGKALVQKLVAGTTSVAAIYQKEYLKIQIPLPPLSIQEEIVAEIEACQKIIDGAKAVVENYKPRIEIDPDWQMVELSEVCEHITKGTTPTTNGFHWQESGINFIKINNINSDGSISNDKMAFISPECHESLKRSQLQQNDILFSIAGTKMGITGIVDTSLLPANTNQALAIIRSKGEYAPQFIKHYLMSTNVQNEMERLKVGVAQSNLSLKQVSQIEIPKVDIGTQREIVAQIEKEQDLVNANIVLIEIFEKKIKDRIAKVWGE